MTIPQEMFATILGVVIVASALGLLGKRPSKPESTEASRPRPVSASCLSFFAIGWYGGFIQAGIGFLFLLVFHRQLKLDLVRANMYKVFVVGCYTIPALAVFIATDNVDWAVGLTLAAGNASGAIASTTVSVRRGEKPIRVVLALVLVAMSIRLIVGSF